MKAEILSARHLIQALISIGLLLGTARLVSLGVKRFGVNCRSQNFIGQAMWSHRLMPSPVYVITHHFQHLGGVFFSVMNCMHLRPE